jgi:hypothetical protein
MVKSAGGLGPYLELLRLKSRFDAPRMLWGGRGVGEILTSMIWVAGRSCWGGLLSAAVIAAIRLIHWVFLEAPTKKHDFYRTHKLQLRLLILWIAPMLLFDLFMYVAMPGHVLNFFPAVAILTSLGFADVSKRVVPSSARSNLRVLSCNLAIVVAVNVVVFTGSPRWTRPLLLGLPLTGAEIREHDANFAACFRTIRQNWPSKNVVLYHRSENFYWGFRQFEYHLPEYRNVLLTTDPSLPGASGTQNWIGYERHTTFGDGLEVSHGQQVLLVVPPGETIDRFKCCFDIQMASLVKDSDIRLYLLHP